MNKPYKKVFSPLILDLVNSRLVPSEDFEDEVSLIPGFMNDKENYGFVVIANKDDKVYYEQHATEERVAAVGIEGDYLLVFEEGKFSPWRLTRDGSLVEEAIFDSRYASDLEYYEEHYGEPKNMKTL